MQISKHQAINALKQTKLNLFKLYEKEHSKIIKQKMQTKFMETEEMNWLGKMEKTTYRIKLADGRKYDSFDIISDGTVVFVHNYLSGPVHGPDNLTEIKRIDNESNI